MKVRAAVLEEFAAPLVVQELDLADPGPGEVLVRLVACGVCHTDMYTASGADPSGYAPTVLGHEGAGVVEAVGEGVELARARRPCGHAVLAPVPGVRALPGPAHEPLPGDPRAAEPGLPAGRHHAPVPGGEPIRHFMGTSTFADHAVMPEIALAKVSPEAPLDRACLFACGLSTGLGAAMFTAEVQPGSTCVVFGAGMVGLGAVAGCRLRGAERIVCVDLSQRAAGVGARPGRHRVLARRRDTPSSACSRAPAGSAPTTPSRPPAWCRSCAKRSRRRAWAGACARYAASRAGARRSTWSRAC